MKTRLKLALGLLLLFALGVATGVAWAPRLPSRHAAHSPFPERAWTERTVSDYQQHLALTPEQADLVRAAAERAAAKISRIRLDTQQQVRDVVKAMNRDLVPSLTAEQRTALQAFVRQRREALAAEAKPE